MWLAAAHCCWARSPAFVINVAVRLSIQKPVWQSKHVVCISQAPITEQVAAVQRQDAAAHATGELEQFLDLNQTAARATGISSFFCVGM